MTTKAVPSGGEIKTATAAFTTTNQLPLDHLFSTSAARNDRWRELNAAAQTWAADFSAATKKKGREAVESALAMVRPLEDYFAYPGQALMKTVSDRIAEEDAVGVARLIRRISGALLSGSYRQNGRDWEAEGEGTDSLPDRLPPSMDRPESHRPYFETLFVASAPASQHAQIAREIRRLRRVEDPTIYEPVIVGSFEDAILGVILNGKLESVVIYDGIPIPSRHDLPLLRDFLTTYAGLDYSSMAPKETGIALARAIKKIRPELDIFLLTDRQVEQVAGDPAASCIRRVFYEVEEMMEIHLCILEGVADRMSTPHFDNLKSYAARPIGTFHALPIARGKSIIKSNWIRDMGEF